MHFFVENFLFKIIRFYLFHMMVRTATEEVARSSVSFQIRAGLVRKDIRPPKLVPTFLWIDNCLMVIDQDLLEISCVTK